MLDEKSYGLVKSLGFSGSLGIILTYISFPELPLIVQIGISGMYASAIVFIWEKIFLPKINKEEIESQEKKMMLDFQNQLLEIDLNPKLKKSHKQELTKNIFEKKADLFFDKYKKKKTLD